MNTFITVSFFIFARAKHVRQVGIVLSLLLLCDPGKRHMVSIIIQYPISHQYFSHFTFYIIWGAKISALVPPSVTRLNTYNIYHYVWYIHYLQPGAIVQRCYCYYLAAVNPAILSTSLKRLWVWQFLCQENTTHQMVVALLWHLCLHVYYCLLVLWNGNECLLYFTSNVVDGFENISYGAVFMKELFVCLGNHWCSLMRWWITKDLSSFSVAVWLNNQGFLLVQLFA